MIFKATPSAVASIAIWFKVGLAAVLCGWALFAVGRFVGKEQGKAEQQVQCAKDQAYAVALEHQLYLKEAARGDQAVAKLQFDLQAQQSAYDDIKRRYANVPRFASTPGCPAAGGVQLTGAGLLRWNAALGYRVMPGTGEPFGAAAGTCAADPAAGACAAESGVTADAAQSNAEDNFGRCAEVRTRCLALIDFIKSRPHAGQANKEIAP